MSRGNCMAGSECLISNKAQTISSTTRNTKRRSDEVRGYYNNVSTNSHRMKMINDMQAFQCSGILNNNLSYASSTPMVNNVAFINKNLKKPTINPRLIDHIYQFRISNDQQKTTAPSTRPLPAPNHHQPPVMVHTPNVQPAVQHIADQAVIMATVGQSSAQVTTTTPTYDSRQFFHFPEPGTCPAVITTHADHSNRDHHVTHASNSLEKVSNSLERGSGLQNHQEGSPACYVVGNKNVTGHLESKNNVTRRRTNHQNDPNFITLIPNTTGPTDCMGRTKYNLVNLPVSNNSSHGNSSHSEWKEEYHELTKLNQAENNPGKPPNQQGSKSHLNLSQNHLQPLSQIIPYARLEPLPLSSSPGNSPNIHSFSMNRRTAPKIVPRQQQQQQQQHNCTTQEKFGQRKDAADNGHHRSSHQNNLVHNTTDSLPPKKAQQNCSEQKMTSSTGEVQQKLRTEHLYENANDCQVVMRNNRTSRCTDNAIKLSYIKESSMSGESLEVKNKLSGGEPLKKETELPNNEDVKLPDLVKEIFSEIDNSEETNARNEGDRKHNSAKQTNRKVSRASQDSKTSSGTSKNSKRHSTEKPRSDQPNRHSTERKVKPAQTTPNDKQTANESRKPDRTLAKQSTNRKSGNTEASTSKQSTGEDENAEPVASRPPRKHKKKAAQLEAVKTAEKEEQKKSPRVAVLKKADSLARKNSPQLETVRRMDALKVTGDKTRKYNASVEDEAETEALLFDKKTKTWKLHQGSAAKQLSIEDEKAGQSTPTTESEQDKFVVRGDDRPHKPLLDPKAHALTDVECCPMLQPMHHRFLGTSSNYSFTSPGKSTRDFPPDGCTSASDMITPKFVYRIETPESHCDLLEFSSDTSGQQSEVSVKRFVPFHSETKHHVPPTLQPQKMGDQVQLYPNGGLKYNKPAKGPLSNTNEQNKSTLSTYNNLPDSKVHNPSQRLSNVETRAYTINIEATKSHPVISPNHPAFHDEYFRYGDDGSFPRSSPGCDVGCMPCLVAPQSKILNGSDAEDTQALLAVLPAPSSTQILDPDWHLSSSEEEEEEEDDASYLLSGGVSEGIMEDQVDEDIGLIPRRTGHESESVFDTFTNKFMQFLEESKDAEGFLGDAAKFWIEHTDDGSHDGSDSNAESSEEEPYIPQKKRIADDTLLGMIKKEERKKQEKLKEGDHEADLDSFETEYLIKSQPLKFDTNTVFYEVDYQGQEGSSVARSGKLVNGSATVRNAPPPQFKSLADMASFRKQEAILKHAEWERKIAEKLGITVEAMRNNPNMLGSPGSGSRSSLRSSRGSLASSRTRK